MKAVLSQKQPTAAVYIDGFHANDAKTPLLGRSELLLGIKTTSDDSPPLALETIQKSGSKQRTDSAQSLPSGGAGCRPPGRLRLMATGLAASKGTLSGSGGCTRPVATRRDELCSR